MSLKPNNLQTTMAGTNLPCDLGDGLVLRFATLADAEPLGQFTGRIFGGERFDEMTAAWTRDYVSESHPAVGPTNVTIVEDTRHQKIVSTMCLIPQTWTFAGIPFGVGRPEAVATDPDYRRRGLVRRQFQVHHARSAAMGHLVQAITGIPWYYRQYGYEYAINLGGGRLVPFQFIAPAKEGETELYRLRPITAEDIPFVALLYERATARSLVACPRPDWMWQHLLTNASPRSFENRPFQIMETADGRPVGYLAPSREMGHDLYAINELEVIQGQSLREVMPFVLRGLKSMAEAQAAEQNKTVNTLFFQIGVDHPLYTAIPDNLGGTRHRYGWYVRVEDIPGFIRQVAPALEERLAQSPLAGYSGELKSNEFTDGLRFVFDKGKLSLIEPWRPGQNETYRAAFPPGVFLKVLFGYNSLAELRTVYADCFAWGEEEVLLQVLFPKQPSNVIPLG
jgi:hypothetical protein